MILFAVLLVGVSSHAFTIDNVHQLSKEPGRVYRGAQPGSKVQELADAKITEVVIFKNDVRGEVDIEGKALDALEIKVNKIPMKWKDITDPVDACEKTVQALKIIQRVSETTGEAVYFHCTAGQDRTGMLAGLFRISKQGWSVKRAYTQELCKYGYAEAGKSGAVARAVQDNLTPIFKKLGAALENGEELSESLCSQTFAGESIELPACK